MKKQTKPKRKRQRYIIKHHKPKIKKIIRLTHAQRLAEKKRLKILKAE